MKIIDAHIHFDNIPEFHALAKESGHENSAAHLEQVFAELNIQGAVVMGNRGLSLEKHAYPDFMRYCIGLDSYTFPVASTQEAVTLLRAHLERRDCVGIKLYPGYNATYVFDPVYDPLYRLAEEFSVPVAVHTGELAGNWGQLKYCHPLTMDEVASKHPELRFVMCHLGNPWVMDAAAVLHKNHNVSADLSGLLGGLLDLPAHLVEMKGYVEHLKTWVHYADAYDRLMFGTDWPLANLRNCIDFVAEIIPARHHETVFYENAKRIYALSF